MHINVGSTPLTSLSKNDPGDDTQRRYRYQAFYAAMLSLELLKSSRIYELEEIFCEHHEDTLVRLTTGQFIGIQVKTRQPGRELFKSSDEQIVKSIARFVELYLDYPNQFCRFIIATNYVFWTERKNGQNFIHLLDVAKSTNDNEISTVDRTLTSFLNSVINSLGKNRANDNSKSVVLNVIQLVEIVDNLPKFDDFEQRLAFSLPEFLDVGEACIQDLMQAARRLISHMFDAGALQHVSARRTYFALCNNPSQHFIEETIEGKRIQKGIVENIIRDSLKTGIALTTSDGIAISDLPLGIRLLDLKMSRGNISLHNIRRAKDHKYSAESFLQKWMYNSRFGQKRRR